MLCISVQYWNLHVHYVALAWIHSFQLNRCAICRSHEITNGQQGTRQSIMFTPAMICSLFLQPYWRSDVCPAASFLKQALLPTWPFELDRRITRSPNQEQSFLIDNIEAPPAENTHRPSPVLRCCAVAQDPSNMTKP